MALWPDQCGPANAGPLRREFNLFSHTISPLSLSRLKRFRRARPTISHAGFLAVRALECPDHAPSVGQARPRADVASAACVRRAATSDAKLTRGYGGALYEQGGLLEFGLSLEYLLANHYDYMTVRPQVNLR